MFQGGSNSILGGCNIVLGGQHILESTPASPGWGTSISREIAASLGSTSIGDSSSTTLGGVAASVWGTSIPKEVTGSSGGVPASPGE